MTQSKTMAILILIATILFVVAPWLTPDFKGYDPALFPVPQDNPPVQPAGYTFAIWGVIYLWLLASALFGLLRAADDPDWQAMRLPLLANLIIGIFWIAVAVVSPLWATVMIFAMAGTAISAFFRSGKYDQLYQVCPVAFYAGWLTAASGAGAGIVLGGYGILSPQTAALVCISIVLIVTVVVQSARPQNWAYPIAVIWALAGIIATNLVQSNWPVFALAGSGLFVLLIRMGATIIRER